MKKKCPVRDGFAFIAPYWHIATTVLVVFIASTMWVGKVDSAVDEITGISGKITKLERKIDYLMYKMGYPYEGAK